jgi:DNA primase small subunit
MSNHIKNDKTMDFIVNNFNAYYKNTNIALPDRFTRREFAFTLFGGKGMIRHLSFDKKTYFHSFLKKKTPSHIYYSTAYYQNPNAPTMQEKNWMGAELIFDLDSDHLPNAKKLNYETQLKMVKEEFYKLVDDFLINDFGFNEKDLELYFSGGRGYHCHVKEKSIFCLDSNERREIVDYITGRDLKETILFHDKVTSTIKIGGRNLPSSKSLKMPKPTDPGWKGRISRGIIEIVDEIKKNKRPIEKLLEYGVDKKDAEKLLFDLSDERVNRIKQGDLDQSKTIRKFFLNNALRRTAVSIAAGETDEPVTCDVKRLIRLPYSLHGKTGLKVEKISLDNLKEFDPLHDTVVLPDDPVKIYLKNDFKIRFKYEDFNLNKGEIELPTYVAVFLIGRGLANIV